MKYLNLHKTLTAVVLAVGPIVTSGALAQSRGGYGMGGGMMGGYGGDWMGGGYSLIFLLVLIVAVIAGLVAWIVAQKKK